MNFPGSQHPTKIQRSLQPPLEVSAVYVHPSIEFLLLAKHSKFPGIMAPMMSWRRLMAASVYSVFFFFIYPRHIHPLYFGAFGAGSVGSLVVLLHTPETQPTQTR
ncbi:hypothetical protein BC826DRAFT_43589 [Russula brevipes]|nr:hypothetical protein BC826DRAFT_43589 [Russula brevipes]